MKLFSTVKILRSMSLILPALLLTLVFSADLSAQPRKARVPGASPDIPSVKPTVLHPPVAPGYIDRTDIQPDPAVVERVRARGFKSKKGRPLALGVRTAERSIVEAPLRDPAQRMDRIATPMPSVPAAPPISGFETNNFDDNIAVNGGFAFIPPDPQGAAGPNHIVVINNTAIRGYDKAGNPLAGLPLASLNTFFGPPADPVGPNASFLFDPKVRYDPFSDRFVAVALERTPTGANPDPGNESRVYVAATASGDPGGAWFTQSVDGKLLFNTNLGDLEFWCDYPGFAVDEEAIYVSCNYFTFPDGTLGIGNLFLFTRVWVFNKLALYSGAPVIPFLYDIATLSGTAQTCDFTFQPAQPHTNPGGSIGTWFTAYSGCADDPVTSDFLLVVRLDNPLSGTPTATAWFPTFGGPLCPNSGPPGYCDWGGTSPQLGSAINISSNDPRTLDSEWRSVNNPGNIWTTATINSSLEPGQATALWTKMDDAVLAAAGPGTSPPITDFGIVGSEDLGAGTHTYFPSITVNNDCVVLGYSASNAAMYAGAYLTALTGNPAAPGPPGPSNAVRLGEDWYVRTFGGPANRWGDYTSMVLDYTAAGGEGPGFWTFNQYAQARGTVINTEDGRWGQYAALYDCSANQPFPVELGAFGATLDNGDVLLAWTTHSEEGNAGFEIEHRTDLQFRKIGWVDGHGTTVDEQSYTFRVADLEPGIHTFRLKQVDYNGAFDFSPEVEVMVDVPHGFFLTEAYPNPFNPTAQFTLMIQEEQHVRVEVYNELGQVVATLHDGVLDANERHRFTIDSGGLPSGVYLYRAVGETFQSETKRVTLLK